MQACTFTLPSSGIPLAISQMHGLGSVVVQLHFDVGPGDEQPGERGLAHLVEHLVLNATPSFPQPNGLGRAFRACGGWVNGATTHTGTTLIARVPYDQAVFALRSLAEAAIRPLLTPETFQAEQRAILTEIAAYQNDSYQRLYDALSMRLEPNTPLGLSITGTEDDVRRLTYNQVLQFFRRLYRANRLIVTVAGNVRDPDLFLHEADQALAPLAQHGPAPARPPLPLPQPEPAGPQAILTTEDEGRSESSFLALMHGPGHSPETRTEALALEAVIDLVASGDDCRLMDELRWKRGLIYSTHYDVDRYRERSVFSFGFACAPAALKECGDTALSVLQTAGTQAAGPWVEQWKRRRAGRIQCAIDDPEYRADRLLFELTMGGSVSSADTAVREVHAVTAHDVQTAAARWLDPNRVAFGVIRGD